MIQTMNDVQNIGLPHMDENHDFVNLYNATSNNETGNAHLNDSIDPNNDNCCKYYTPDESIKTIGLENNQLSMFCTNCRRGDRGWLSHGLVVTLPTSYSLNGGTLWGFTRDMRIAD